LDRATVF